MSRLLLPLLGAASLACAVDDGLVVDVKLGYLAAQTRQYETGTYIERIPVGGGGSVAVARLGIFPGDDVSDGHGLRIATAVSGRTRLTWYGEAAIELLLDDQGDIDHGRQEFLLGGGLQFTIAGRLAIKAGVELGYAELDFDTTDWVGNYVEYDGSGQSYAVKAGLEQGFGGWMAGLSIRGVHRSETIKNPGNYIDYEDDRLEALLELGIRL